MLRQTILCLLLSTTVLTNTIPRQSNELFNDEPVLKRIFVIHRHGDRTPIDTYPRDPYRNESYWPDGWGQLTVKGKQRMYEVGRFLRKRYQNFLGTSPREAYARSSAQDRCLESVELLMAGLYPPEMRWQWSTGLGKVWQPFPIKTVTFEHDPMLNPDSECPTARKEIDRIYNSKFVRDYYDRLEPTLSYVRSNAGLPTMPTLIQAEELFDTLLIERLNNLKLPAWVDQYVYEQLSDVMAKTFIFDALTPKIQRLRAGSLLKEIVSNMTQDIERNRKIFIYSTHDTMLSVFLTSLNAYNEIPPPFGATVLMEVYDNSTNGEFIKAYYLNETETESPYSLPLTNCINIAEPSKDPLCTVANFRLSVQDLLPGDWKAECEHKSKPQIDVNNVYFLMITFVLTVIVLNFFIYLYYFNRRHLNQYRMLPVS